MRARSPPRGWVGTRGGGGSGAFAVCGLTSRVDRGVGTLLAEPDTVSDRSGVVRGPGVRALRGGGTKCTAPQPRRAPPLRRGGGAGDRGGAPCWALLPPGLHWLGPNVVEDVLGGSGSCCRRGAGLRLGLEFGCRLRSRRAGGSGWLPGGGLGFPPGCRRGLCRGVGLGSGGVARGGDGFGGPFGRFPLRPWGVECWTTTW